MIQPSQREKFLIILAAGVLFVVVSFLIWRPIVRSWRDSSRRLAQAKQYLQSVEETLAKQPKLTEEFEDLVKVMEKAGGPSPVPNALQKVEQFANESSVVLRNRTVEQPRNRGGFTEVAVNCSAEAGLQSLVDFLIKIKTAQDLLDVIELKITPTPANPAVLRADVRISALSVSGR